MGKYLRKCKELEEGEVVMEKAGETAAGRKRKSGLGESQLSTSSVQVKTRRLAAVTPENSAASLSSSNSTCESVSSDHVLASCCSSNGSSEVAKESSKCVDLEENEVTVEIFATSAGDSLDCRYRREATRLSEVQAEPGELESTARPCVLNSSRRPTGEKMPSESEIEEFFAAAEKNLQEEFIKKYNYDIVNDQPLEGRYEWVQIRLEP